MDTTVKITGDEHGNVITQSTNNPEYGYVRVEQVRILHDDNGFLRKRVVSALIQGTMDTLKEVNYRNGQELPGRIVTIESLNPFNKKDPSKHVKQAGNTGVVCKLKGQPIYRKTLYTLISNVDDELIKHDNTEEIKAANLLKDKKPSALNILASDEFK
jgi:hypothetical protein